MGPHYQVQALGLGLLFVGLSAAAAASLAGPAAGPACPGTGDPQPGMERSTISAAFQEIQVVQAAGGGTEGIQLGPPRFEDVFRPESEATWRQRLRESARQRNAKITFPQDAALAPSGPANGGRALPPLAATFVPNYVCYQPLYFEDKNTERYGWHLWPVQPLVSTGKFYLDAVLLPCHMLLFPPCARECNTGYPLPGDPVPCMIYPPRCSWQHAGPDGAACDCGNSGSARP